MNQLSKIWAIVPAHNEERIIAQTISDLFSQSHPVSILIVADNCDDKTVEIVKSLQRETEVLHLFETVENKARKAGAVNQAFKTLTQDIEAVLLMDADTQIHPRAVEKGWKVLKERDDIAAVCSKAGVLPYRTKNPSKWLLHTLQRLEYSVFDSQRVETLNNIKVVHGMAALHRWKALKEVGFYDEGNLVEDYELTLRYKENGWRVTTELEMKAWTEVPTTWSEWWKQRLRWNRGGVDTLKQHGWNKTTKADIMQHIWVNVLLLFQWFFLIAFVVMIANGTFMMHFIIFLAIIFGLADSIYRLRYLDRPKFTDFLTRILIVPEMLYGYIRTVNLYHSYIFFLFNKKQSW